MTGTTAPRAAAESQQVAAPPPPFAHTPAATAADAVQHQLNKILASRTFTRSKELRRFLHYAVEQRLLDPSLRLKEYLVGVAVFGRGDNFNPGMDPIVRVQARRLRSKLSLYYETEGAADSVSIHLPVGGYAPVFAVRSPAPSGSPLADHAREMRPATEPRPSIAVLPFVNIGFHENDRFSDGLMEELIHALSSAAVLRVLSRTSALQFHGKTNDLRSLGEQLGVDAVVEGSVRADGNRLRVAAGLIAGKDGGLLWSGIYDHTANEMFSVQRDIAERIARTIEAHLTGKPQPLNSTKAIA